MAGVELATAYVSLVVEGSKVAPGVKKSLTGAESEATRSGARSGKRFTSSFGSSLKGVGSALLGAFAVTKGIDFFKSTIAEATEAAVVTKRTSNVIKSMGGAANISARQVAKLSGQLSNKVGIDDEAIQSGANLVLTFGNIRNEVGKGNDIFNQTTGLMVDMSVAMGQDMKSSAIQLGKALNDPIKGVTALQRVGVAFTEDQKKQIKALVESGKTLEAQKIILGEVKKEFGGAGKAMSTPAQRAETAWNNLKEQIGTQLLPTVTRFEGWLTNKAIPAVSKFFGQMKRGKGAGGELADTLRTVRDVADKVVHRVGDIIQAFNGMPGWAKKLLIGGGATVAVGSKLGLGKLTGSLGRTAAGALGKSVGVQKVFETNPAALGGGKGGGAGDIVKGAATGSAAAAIATYLGPPLAAAIGAFIITHVPGQSGADKQLNRDAYVGANQGGAGSGSGGGMGLPTDLGKSLVSDPGPRIFPLKLAPNFVKDITAAADQARVLTDVISKVPPELKTKVSTPGAIDSVSEVTKLAKKYDLTPKEVRTLMKVQDFATKDIKRVQKDLRDTDKVKTNPLIDAITAPFFGKSGKVNKELTDTGRRKVSPTIDANTKSGMTKIQAIKTTLNNLVNSPWTVFVGVSGPGAKKRASGGQVTAGQPYIVGENRPELFIPNQSGRINPRPTLAAPPSSGRTESIISDRDLDRIAAACARGTFDGASGAHGAMVKRLTVAARI